MKRGITVITIGRGDFSNKPRPSLVVQADAFNEHHSAVKVCPITSHVTGDSRFRIGMIADSNNGLDRGSEVEIDRVQAIWRERVQYRLGSAPPRYHVQCRPATTVAGALITAS